MSNPDAHPDPEQILNLDPALAATRKDVLPLHPAVVRQLQSGLGSMPESWQDLGMSAMVHALFALEDDSVIDQIVAVTSWSDLRITMGDDLSTVNWYFEEELNTILRGRTDLFDPNGRATNLGLYAIGFGLTGGAITDTAAERGKLLGVHDPTQRLTHSVEGSPDELRRYLRVLDNPDGSVSFVALLGDVAANFAPRMSDAAIPVLRGAWDILRLNERQFGGPPVDLTRPLDDAAGVVGQLSPEDVFRN